MAFPRTRLTHRNSFAPLPCRFKHGHIVEMGGRGGPRTGVLAAFGVACAMFVHTVAAALGLSALFLALPTLYHVLRWAGAAYLLYQAFRAFRGGGPVTADGTTDSGRR